MSSEEKSARQQQMQSRFHEISEMTQQQEFFKDSLQPSEEDTRSPAAMLGQFPERTSIEYDEREFIMSTQEGHLQKPLDKKVV